MTGSDNQPPKKTAPFGGPDLMEQLARMGVIGTEFATAVAVLGFFGWLADRWLGTRPWLLLVGCGLGLLVGTYRFVRAALAATRQGSGGTRNG